MSRSYWRAGLSQLGPVHGTHRNDPVNFVFSTKNKHLQQAWGFYPKSPLPPDHPARLMYESALIDRAAMRLHSNQARRRKYKPSMPKLKCLEKPYADDE